MDRRYSFSPVLIFSIGAVTGVIGARLVYAKQLRRQAEEARAREIALRAEFISREEIFWDQAASESRDAREELWRLSLQAINMEVREEELRQQFAAEAKVREDALRSEFAAGESVLRALGALQFGFHQFAERQLTTPELVTPLAAPTLPAGQDALIPPANPDFPIVARVTWQAPDGVEFRYSVVRSLSIIWLNGQYWERRNNATESPEFGEYAHLNHVCWLEISGNLPGRIPSGLYYLVYRMKIDNQAVDFHADWSVRQNEQDLCQFATNENSLELRSTLNRGWFFFNIGLFRVKDAGSPVFVRIFGGSAYWCHGLSIDGVYVCRAQLPWSAIKPLHLGIVKDSKSSLRGLPKDTIKVIQSYLAVVPE